VPGYKETLNLPRTDFPMKADLVRREPQFLELWNKMDVYGQIRERRAGAEKFILHDGPPYASGSIHIGTGLNKALKDIIIRFKTMQGYDAPFIPGWDCHGLPIEHQVMKELGKAARDMSVEDIRTRCREYAMAHIGQHKAQFTALGVFGDWERPYLTLDHDYEAAVMDALADLVEKGYIYKALRPIHWCMHCRTALAEAELEYADDESPSIYVKFPMIDSVAELYDGIGDEPVSVLIWTTTPWTLPANRAIALHPYNDYVAVRWNDPNTGRPEVVILAAERIDAVMQAVGVTEFTKLNSRRGSELEGLKYRHCLDPERACPIVLANYVTLDDGTGCVHTAPGHGREDYLTGLEYDIEIASPVDQAGCFTEEAKVFAGMKVWNANPEICSKLKNDGLLVHEEVFSHSYPHCWRCKKPVIFRATEQWFVSVEHENLRQRMLAAIAKVNWVPAWGRSRIEAMVQERPDWCISRQRIWGVPVPAFNCKSCGKAVLTVETVRAAQKLFAESGSDAWFTTDTAEIVPDGLACPDCGGADFEKETDILDVWFESSVSHRAVIDGREELTFPADLYLEGSDQHRGWFQVSLLSSMAANDAAPFRTVLTHGFVVDENGQKMSKSLGNFISLEDGLNEFGGDMLRMWSASVDYRQDINVSRSTLEHLSQAYRRIRNTFRHLLANTSDFDPATQNVPYDQMLEIDRWALSRLHNLVGQVTRAYEEYQFHRVWHMVHNFCTVEMSAFYLDVLKDRLYTLGATSVERRSGQTAFNEMLLTLVRLMAPILVHTTEEVWQEMEGKVDAPSVHLSDWPEADAERIDADLEARWERLGKVRQAVNKALEDAKQAKLIGGSLEACVSLNITDAGLLDFLRDYEDELPTVFIVSEVKLPDKPAPVSADNGVAEEVTVDVRRCQHAKCERCWNLRASVGSSADHPALCRRCVGVVTGAL